MKTKIKIVALFLMLFAVTIIAPQKAPAQGISISFQVFYDELSPYGNWVFNPEYGYVWMPDVDQGFFPYATDGQWVFTDDGWTWVSFYQWGWAPFHYGRWYIDPFYGPMWVPGYEWGPGWVVWSRGGDCYGWAPMGPGISYASVYGRDYHMPYNYWRFVRDRDFGRPYIYNYYIDNSTNVTIINNITVINNTRVDRSRNVTYNAGPDRYEVEKHAGRPVNRVVVKESNKPRQDLSNNELVIYRPKVEKNDAVSQKPAPSKVVRLENTKPAAYKTADVTRQKSNQPVNQEQKKPRYSNPSGKPETERQPQQGKPSVNKEGVKQPQHGKPSGNAGAVKQPQHNKPSGNSEAVKQPQHDKPSGNSEAVKQPQHDKPSGNKEAVKQPQQESHSKNDGGGKQEQHNNKAKK